MKPNRNRVPGVYNTPGRGFFAASTNYFCHAKYTDFIFPVKKYYLISYNGLPAKKDRSKNGIDIENVRMYYW